MSLIYYMFQVNVSTWTLVAICLDRYNAIIHPLATRQSKSRARSVQGRISLRPGQYRGGLVKGQVSTGED